MFDEIVAVKQACAGAAPPEGDPGDRRAGHLRQRPAGVAGWPCWPAPTSIKTSTGKIAPAATLPVVHVMLQAVRDWHRLTGERRGVKAAGGIRNTKDAIRYLVAVHEVAGPEWLDPRLFRFGASGLLERPAAAAAHPTRRPLHRAPTTSASA